MNAEQILLAQEAAVLSTISDFLYSYWLIYVLVGAGLFFTIATKGVQIRHFGRMWKAIVAREEAAAGISSFQAFATGMASRVGIGNIVGVAIALTLGGPGGAIFWMWVVAFLGMATGFVEATLAQVFKVRNADGSYRGGPAYYIKTGLKQRWLAIVFAFAFTTIFGNYSYAEVNLNYLGVHGRGILVFRLLVIMGVGLGSILALATVWDIADVVMALMATVNLVSIMLLFGWFRGALKDYEGRVGTDRINERFVGQGNPLLPGDVPGDVWAEGAKDHQAEPVLK